MNSEQIKAEEGRRDVSLRTAQLVDLLTKLGPDIPEIARRLGQFKESVRYRFKQKLLSKGFAVQAAVDHEKLGLRRVVSIVKFGDQYEAYAESILTAMSELCYLVSFEMTLPEGYFILNFSVPDEFVPEFVSFIDALKKKGLFTRAESHVFDSFRNTPMRAEFYDFNSGVWDFDWSSTSLTPEAISYVQAKPVKFDYLDLLLLKELQIDATRSLVQIASRLGLNYKKLAWHYSAHVQRAGLIEGYTVNWMGTRYEYRLEKALHRKHRYVRINLLVECRNDSERLSLMSKSNRLPFLWAEAFGKDYYTEFAFPADDVNEAMQYLRSMLRSMDERARYFVMDQTNALAFTISYKLFDQETGRWKFDREELLRRFDNLIIKIKEGPN
jgi:DNA-binding Lrp family transcriptional regulator